MNWTSRDHTADQRSGGRPEGAPRWCQKNQVEHNCFTVGSIVNESSCQIRLISRFLGNERVAFVLRRNSKRAIWKAISDEVAQGDFSEMEINPPTRYLSINRPQFRAITKS